jgi:hypothetical protein
MLDLHALEEKLLEPLSTKGKFLIEGCKSCLAFDLRLVFGVTLRLSARGSSTKMELLLRYKPICLSGSLIGNHRAYSLEGGRCKSLRVSASRTEKSIIVHLCCGLCDHIVHTRLDQQLWNTLIRTPLNGPISLALVCRENPKKYGNTALVGEEEGREGHRAE